MVSTTLLTAYFGGRLPYTNEYDHYLFLFLYIPNQNDISLFLVVLFSDNFLARLLKSFFCIGLSRQYNIGSYIRYEPLYIISCFHYSKVRTEETGNCSNPHLYRWRFPARSITYFFLRFLMVSRSRTSSICKIFSSVRFILPAAALDPSCLIFEEKGITGPIPGNVNM